MGKKNKAERLIIYLYEGDVEKIKEIKEKKFLGLEKNETNKEIFFYFMSIGLQYYVENEQLKRDSTGYIRREYLKDEDMTYVYAASLKKFGDIEVLEDENKMFEYAEKCSHYGILYIYSQLKTRDINQLKYNIIENLKEKIKD